MFSISSYFSVQYTLILLPITLVLYAVSSQKKRRIVLLLASYAFFGAVSGKLISYLLFSTLSVHHIGIWLSDVQRNCDELLKETPKESKKAIKAQYTKKKKCIVALAIIIHIGLLLLLKYTPFFVTSIDDLLKLLKVQFSIKVPKFLLPIGISFYTLQAVSYIVDVYQKKIQADHSLFRLALFMSFFPQIMEGPICRYSQTAEQIWEAKPIKYENLMLGLQRMCFGLMKKIVLADRLNKIIKNVFGNYGNYDGFVIAIAAVCYTIQLYMDFSGTMDMVIGTSQIFGIELPENFKRPFFSKSISEFWKRWHVTLGEWLKDYVFFPLSMSKPLKKLTSKARKKLGNHFGPLIAGSIALLCVWICNGLWHGAGWHYLFFGMYHFVLILIGNIFAPSIINIAKKIHLDRNKLWYRCIQIIRTSILVCIGELFFRADNLKIGFGMIGKIFTQFKFESLTNQTLFTFGMDRGDYIITFVTLAIVFIISIMNEKGIKIRKNILTKNIAVRYAVWYALIFFIIIFGAYGQGYIPVDPIYAGF